MKLETRSQHVSMDLGRVWVLGQLTRHPIESQCQSSDSVQGSNDTVSARCRGLFKDLIAWYEHETHVPDVPSPNL